MGEISCATFWTIIVRRAIDQLKVSVTSDALMTSIATLHTIGIIVADPSKFSFIESIPVAMFRDVPACSKILDEFQEILAKADKAKKGGRGSKMARKKDASELCIEENQPVCNEEEGNVRNEEGEQVHTEPLVRIKAPSPNREVTPPLNDFVPSPPPSPKTTTSLPITIAPWPPQVSSSPPTTIPISIPIFTDLTIPPKTSVATVSSVNVSDTRATSSGFSTHVSPPISPIRTDDPNMIFGEDDDDLGRFTYSPFQIRTQRKDEATMSQGQLRSLHEKIDQLLLASKASSSKSESQKENVANATTMSKAVSDSAEVCKPTTEKVDKLISDAIEFMEDYKNAYNSNTVINQAIHNVGALLKEEKANFVQLRNDFHTDQEAFQYSSGVRYVIPFGGCFETGVLLETRGRMWLYFSKERTSQSPSKPVVKKEPKGKETLFENEPFIGDDDEDEEPDEAELKRRKVCEAELNENALIVKEAEEKERAENEAHATLKSRMLLFHRWILKRIQNKVVDLPSQYWLDLVASFVVNAPFTDIGAHQMLFAFYLKHMKHQFETWSANKIVFVKVTGLIETESFSNANFKVMRGSASQPYEFTLVDLPCLNPNEWMVIFNMLQKEKEVYEPVMSHLQLMIMSYIQEVRLMDVDIATVLKKKMSVVPKEAPKDFEKLKSGKIYKEGWFVVYTSRYRPGADRRKSYFYLKYKRLYSTSCLEFVLDMLTKFKGNNKDDVKCFTDMITWYIHVCKQLLCFIPKIYEVQKRITN
uniref:Uncharacterized protein n=1 Tax=Lactuca sativa TaxID=4236 RepID=A0A9R1XMH5_LACSA|nr:hypothetical protein LSAT_V11C300140950 [Lactuca sativa]